MVQRYSFTVSNNQVTGMSAVQGTGSHDLRLPANSSFSVGSNTVTETLTGPHQVTTVTYTQEIANSALYDVSQIATVITDPTTAAPDGSTIGYGFTIENGAVTAEQVSFSHGSHSSNAAVPLPLDAQFAVSNGVVTETAVAGNAVETAQYASGAGGLYALSSVSTSYIDPGTATTDLWVNPHDRLEFTVTGGAITAVQAVNAQGVASPITPSSHTTYSVLAPGYAEAVTTYGSHSSYEVFYAGQNSGGVYTEVAHGLGSAADLAGLQAQMAHLPQATDWLI